MSTFMKSPLRYGLCVYQQFSYFTSSSSYMCQVSLLSTGTVYESVTDDAVDATAESNGHIRRYEFVVVDPYIKMYIPSQVLPQGS